jgi:predicted regulator of Ras-like GTPase activity (Roadblock/LC7/MglB family)
MSASPVQVRQWSEEVAADPGAPAFLPLAETYRAMGRRDAAVRLLLRGLERHPDHVEAHHLLGLLYRDGGEAVKAFDEWDIALRLSPDHGAARREIGLLCAARGEWARAARHLERAAAADPADAEVADALARARAGAGGVSAAPAPASPPPPQPAMPWESPPAEPAATGTVAGAASAPSSSGADATPSASSETPPPVAPNGADASPPSPADATASASPPPASAGAAAAGAGAWETLGAEFTQLSGERGIVGAVLLDDRGYVLAGRMNVDGRDRAPEVAAVLSGASSEAERAVRHLKMGEWRGILLETPEATVRLAPAGDGGMLAIAARREVPTGWVLRIASRARDAALRALGGGEAP